MTTVVLSGNQDLILSALNTLLTFNAEQPAATVEEVFKQAQPDLSKLLGQIAEVVRSAPYEHVSFKNSVSRTFGIASLFATHSLSSQNTSITTDGEYLYLAIGLPKRANLYKIGLGGESDTIAGKVYQ
jgi:hypothetical protein